MSRLLDAMIYGYRTLMAGGTALTQRSALNFVDMVPTDNPGQGRTDLSLPGGGALPAVTLENLHLTTNAGLTAEWQTYVPLGSVPATTGRIRMTDGDQISFRINGVNITGLYGYASGADNVVQLGGTNTTFVAQRCSYHVFQTAAGAEGLTISTSGAVPGAITVSLSGVLSLTQTATTVAAGRATVWQAQDSTFGAGANSETYAGDSTVAAGGTVLHVAGAGNVAGANGIAKTQARLHEYWDQPGANQIGSFYYSTFPYLDMSGANAFIRVPGGNMFLVTGGSFYQRGAYINMQDGSAQDSIIMQLSGVGVTKMRFASGCTPTIEQDISTSGAGTITTLRAQAAKVGSNASGGALALGGGAKDGAGYDGAVSCITPLVLPSYTVAGAPGAAGYSGGLIYVSNESGGAVPAFSDGTNWRRVTDRTIIS